MITKSNGFLSKLGNIFKTEEEALTENRQDILGKYLLREDCSYEWLNTGGRNKTVTIQKDNMAINNFIKYYDDVMRQLKELDKNVSN